LQLRIAVDRTESCSCSSPPCAGPWIANAAQAQQVLAPFRDAPELGRRESLWDKWTQTASARISVLSVCRSNCDYVTIFQEACFYSSPHATLAIPWHIYELVPTRRPLPYVTPGRSQRHHMLRYR
jgi:hypothetical protein